MSPDPYTRDLFHGECPFSTKTMVVGRINCVLQVRSAKRGLKLCPYPSRAVIKNEIHELILAAKGSAAPGRTINQVAYLGFFEVIEGGLIWVGDCVDIDGAPIGHVAGFDLTHSPNHLNIVIHAPEPLRTGKENGIQLKSTIHFVQPA